MGAIRPPVLGFEGICAAPDDNLSATLLDYSSGDGPSGSDRRPMKYRRISQISCRQLLDDNLQLSQSWLCSSMPHPDWLKQANLSDIIPSVPSPGTLSQPLGHILSACRMVTIDKNPSIASPLPAAVPSPRTDCQVRS